MLSRLSPNLKKEKDLWNKILLCVEVGDKVRFKHGRVTWEIYFIKQLPTGMQCLKLRRMARYKNYPSISWNPYFDTMVFKDVFQGTEEYRNMRIVSK